MTPVRGRIATARQTGEPPAGGGRQGIGLLGGRGVLAAIALAGSGALALAGHEVTFYPSYYPQEISIDSVPPDAALVHLGDGTLHAYLGEAPEDETSLPGTVKALESLGSFVVVQVNATSTAMASEGERCAAVREIADALRSGGPSFVFHPYPVTPYHPDYLHHLDRVEEAKAAFERESSMATRLRVRARGRHAEALARARWALDPETWDVSLDEIPVSRVLDELAQPFNGWLGSPWNKEGWFQAYALLAPALGDAEAEQAAATLFRSLVNGEYLDLAAQADLERRLVARLTEGCSRMVVGYTLRREFYNDDYTAGIENIGYDSQTGLNSPIFIRTVKLKDYPWNGELHLGVNGAPEAAWNPVAGFTDSGGRLIWSIVGDPALMPIPYNAGWVPNRLEFTLERVRGQSGGVEVPDDAVLPEPGTGALRTVPARSFASAKLVYRLSASPFLDGTETAVADLIYPLAHAYRWGVKADADDRAYDPQVAAATAQIRDRLVGIRTLRVDRATDEITPGIQVARITPVIEIYLRNTPGDEHQVAALAPPWSTVPWHLMVLMEEAVLRRLAAFSKAEADRLGVPWLDLVRDPALHKQLRGLIDEFERSGFRPATLRDQVSDDDARARWRALRDFAEANGHLLDTNGPYRLKAWRPGSAIFSVNRDMTYPLGFGTFDTFVHPLRAEVREVTREAGRITVRVEVQKTVKVQRHYETSLVPLNRNTSRGVYGALVVSRYLLIGPHGRVVIADKMQWQGDDRFLVELPEDLLPGRYAVLVAVYLDGNTLQPSTGMLWFEAQG